MMYANTTTLDLLDLGLVSPQFMPATIEQDDDLAISNTPANNNITDESILLSENDVIFPQTAPMTNMKGDLQWPLEAILDDTMTSDSDLTSAWSPAESLKPFVEMDSIAEVPATPPSTNDGEYSQTLIDEMEEFLSDYGNTMNVDDNAKFEPIATNGSFVDVKPKPIVVGSQPVVQPDTLESETIMAEKLLDALMKGNVTSSPQNKPVAVSNTLNAQIVGGFDLSSIQHIVTDEGQNVVIVIAPPSSPKLSQSRNSVPTSVAATTDSIGIGSPDQMLIRDESPMMLQATSTPSPSTYSESAWSPSNQSDMAFEDNTSDSDWSPNSPIETPKRKIGRPTATTSNNNATKSSRTQRKRKPYSIQDKKERKKQQNVEAARRYRDKKKAEQMVIEGEEDQLRQKNERLKGQLKDIENEVKTLKKLMTELGLVKLINNNN